jgi:hypothetical protein
MRRFAARQGCLRSLLSTMLLGIGCGERSRPQTVSGLDSRSHDGRSDRVARSAVIDAGWADASVAERDDSSDTDDAGLRAGQPSESAWRVSSAQARTPLLLTSSDHNGQARRIKL